MFCFLRDYLNKCKRIFCEYENLFGRESFFGSFQHQTTNNLFYVQKKQKVFWPLSSLLLCLLSLFALCLLVFPFRYSVYESICLKGIYAFSGIDDITYNILYTWYFPFSIYKLCDIIIFCFSSSAQNQKAIKQPRRSSKKRYLLQNH